MLSRGRVAVGASCLVLGLMARPAEAGLRTWGHPDGGLFTDGKNWSTGSAPGKLDDAQFNLGGAYTIDFTKNRVNQRLLIGDDLVVFDLGGKNYELAAEKLPSISLGLTRGDVARITVLDGGLTAIDACIGLTDGAGGNITVAKGGMLHTTRNLIIGDGGTGGLTILAGGQVRNNNVRVGEEAGSRGNVFLSSDSQWNVDRFLFVGGDKAGAGNVVIRDGASLDVERAVTVGRNGRIVLDGGSIFAANLRNQGEFEFRSGSLHIEKEKLTLGGKGPLGNRLRLTEQRKLEVAGDVRLAKKSILTIDQGGFSAGRAINLGRINLSEDSELDAGMVTNRGRIRGDGVIDSRVKNRKTGRIEVLNSFHMLVQRGLANQGTLALRNGGLEVNGPLINRATGVINGEGELSAGGGVLNMGTLTFDGGTTINGELTNLMNGRIIARNETISFMGNVAHSGREIQVSPGGEIVMHGEVSGGGDFTGAGLTRFQRSFSPGEGIGSVSFGGDVVFGEEGALNIEVGANTHDSIQVAGSLTLNDVIISIGGGRVRAGDVLTIATAEQIEYRGSISILAPANGLSLTVDQSSTALTVTVVPEPSLSVLGVLCGLALRRRRN